MTPRDLLDPEIAPSIEHIPFDDLTPEILATLRGLMGGALPLSDAVDRTDHVVPGDPDVPLRVHRPVGAEGPLPCVYWMHGGGYVIGSNTIDDLFFDELCPKLGCVGVSVDYRLAPETAYPDPLEDCYRGLRWTHEHAAELGIDPDRIGVAGVSAGGGLAAALALLARDRGEVPLAFQLLDSPMIDDRQINQLESAGRASRCGVATRTRSGGRRISAISTAATTCPQPRRLRAPPTCRDCHPRTSPSAPSTGSATRMSTTRCD